MDTGRVDHVKVLVENLEETVSVFEYVFGMRFQDAPIPENPTLRRVIDEVNGQVELWSVVDRAAAASRKDMAAIKEGKK